uniref:Uncharacterized protein n=1 Tax=viral metagenome TaxID=1070528 RepID=A0A6C0IBH1_9ZZZZ
MILRVLGSGVLGSWGPGVLGSWGPGVLGSWGPGVLGFQPYYKCLEPGEEYNIL